MVSSGFGAGGCGGGGGVRMGARERSVGVGEVASATYLSRGVRLTRGSILTSCVRERASSPAACTSTDAVSAHETSNMDEARSVLGDELGDECGGGATLAEVDG